MRDIPIERRAQGIRKRRVVIFEDEAAILTLLSSFFSKRGYEVFTYREPVTCPLYDQGAERCVNCDPCADLLLTDYRMPKMNGMELLQAQGQRGCKLDVKNKAMISGFLDEETERMLRDAGFEVFRKPFDLSELSAWVRECETRMDISQPVGILRSSSG